MYCEEQKCCCKGIQRIIKLNYSKWGTWIKKWLTKENSSVGKDCTLITFEDFKRLVLKENTENYEIY